MSESDIKFIRNNYKTMTYSEIAKVLGRSAGSIKDKARKLGLNKVRVLTDNEKEFIKENYKTMKYKEIAEKLNISTDLLKSKMQKEMKLKRRITIPHHYTDEENEFIKNNYLNMKSKDIGKKFNTDANSIHNQLKKLGLARDSTWSGEKHPNYQGGIAFEPYDSNFHYKFKTLIKQRDGFLCQKCGMREEDSKTLFTKGLAVHHIDYNKKLTIKENCCSLCLRCNSEVNSNRKSWTLFFQSILSEKYGYKYEEGKIILNIDGGQDGKS